MEQLLTGLFYGFIGGMALTFIVFPIIGGLIGHKRDEFNRGEGKI